MCSRRITCHRFSLFVPYSCFSSYGRFDAERPSATPLRIKQIEKHQAWVKDRIRRREYEHVRPDKWTARIADIDISRHARALCLFRLTGTVLALVCACAAFDALWRLFLQSSDANQVTVLIPVEIPLLSFAAFAGWRHVDVISAEDWGIYNAAFPLLILCVIAALFRDMSLFRSAGKSIHSFSDVFETDPESAINIAVGLLTVTWIDI